MRPIATPLQLLLSWIRGAREDCDAGLIKQFYRFLRLRLRNPTMTLRSYYEHGLYDGRHGVSRSDVEFIGRRYTARLSEALNPRGAVSIAWDKMLFEIYAQAFSINSPETIAVYSPTGRCPAHVKHRLQSIDDVVKFLQTPENYPMFVKPVHSQQGIGGYLLTAYDLQSERIEVKKEGAVGVQDLLSLTLKRRSSFYRERAGYLFQKVVTQHPALSNLTGSKALSGMRIISLVDASGQPFVHRAVLKVIVGENAQDNFRLGQSGNLVCNIDVDSGVLGPGITGPWPGASWVDAHPDTGNPLSGFEIPNWAVIAQEVCRASLLLGGMRICHWDVVCGEDGPIFLEVNDIGGIFLPQAAGQGLFDERLGALLSTHGQLKNERAITGLLKRRGHLPLRQ